MTCIESARRILASGVITLTMLLVPVGRAKALVTLEPAESGRGWSLVRIDVDVTLEPERSAFTTEGTLTLKLTGLDESYGPVLLLSTQRTREGRHAIVFLRVESHGAKAEILDKALQDRWQQGAVRYEEPLARGSTIEVSFACETQGQVRRMIVHETAAMADWINAWLPFTLPEMGQEPGFTPNLFRAPGRTTLHLPPGWKGLVDGNLIERVEKPEGAVEVWRTPEGLARGFVAGPFKIIRETVSGREIRIYLRDAMPASEAASLAMRLGQAMSALEAELGPLPILGAYSVVDFPRLP